VLNAHEVERASIVFPLGFVCDDIENNEGGEERGRVWEKKWMTLKILDSPRNRVFILD